MALADVGGGASHGDRVRALLTRRDTLPAMIETVERSTRMSVIDHDAAGLIEQVGIYT